MGIHEYGPHNQWKQGRSESKPAPTPGPEKDEDCLSVFPPLLLPWPFALSMASGGESTSGKAAGIRGPLQLTEADVIDVDKSLISELVALNDVAQEHHVPSGVRIGVSWTAPSKSGEDFACDVGISFDNAEVIQARVELTKWLARDIIAQAQGLNAVMELVPLAAYEALDSEAEKFELRIGVLRISGSVVGSAKLRETVERVLTSVARQTDPGFDRYCLYGCFPRSGVEYFYGGAYRV